MEVTWSECVQLYYDLQNGKPGIDDRIKKVDSLDFSEFLSVAVSKKKKILEAVKNVIDMIQHLKIFSVGFKSAAKPLLPYHLIVIQLTDEHDFEMLSNVCENVKIDQLNVFNIEFSPNCMFHIIQWCKICKVKALLLNNCNLMSKHLKEFAKYAKETKVKLKTLDLSLNYFCSNCMNYVAEICEKRLKLQLVAPVKSGIFLWAELQFLSPQLLIKSAENPNNIKLEELNVSCNRFSPNGMVHLAEICKICEVKSLELRRCYLELEHLVKFAENVKNTKIVELNISENEKLFQRSILSALFTPRTKLLCLVKICEICQVEKLHIEKCDMKSDQLQNFIKLAKDTKIVEIDLTQNYEISEDAKTDLQKFLERNKKKLEAEVDATAAVVDVNVTQSSGECYESHLDDPYIYHVSRNRKKGKVLIINNEFRRTDRERRGSLVDLQNQEDLWTGLGFDVVTKRDLTADDMRSVCKEFARDVTNTSVVVVIVMTHGGIGSGGEVLEGEDERFVYTGDVVNVFNTNNSPLLQGIPKVFFFQACRGSNRDSGLATDATITKYPLRSDMLITYPSQAGFVSFRNVEEGSWLMNAVTNIFMRHAHNTHVIDMLTMVNNSVARKESDTGDVQMSNQESYLRKKPSCSQGGLTK